MVTKSFIGEISPNFYFIFCEICLKNLFHFSKAKFHVCALYMCTCTCISMFMCLLCMCTWTCLSEISRNYFIGSKKTWKISGNHHSFFQISYFVKFLKQILWQSVADKLWEPSPSDQLADFETLQCWINHDQKLAYVKRWACVLENSGYYRKIEVCIKIWADLLHIVTKTVANTKKFSLNVQWV